MRSSYYKLLRISPAASREEIKARYLELMLRYHPDINRSPAAHARATEINEAFRILMDADLRAQHDAELAQRRRDAVTARTISLSRGARSSALTMRRRRPLLRRYAAHLVFAAVLAAATGTGWHIEQRLLVSPSAAFSIADSGAGNEEAVQAVAALNAATAREARAMPPVSRAAIADAMDALQRITAAGDMTQARLFSERCHAQTAEIGTWDALDQCVAFDQAVFMRHGSDRLMADADYFMDRHDHAAHLYVTKVPSMDAIGMRLKQIRRMVAPEPDQRLEARTAQAVHSIAKHGWKFARSLFSEQEEHRSRPHDF